MNFCPTFRLEIRFCLRGLGHVHPWCCLSLILRGNPRPLLIVAMRRSDTTSKTPPVDEHYNVEETPEKFEVVLPDRWCASLAEGTTSKTNAAVSTPTKMKQSSLETEEPTSNSMISLNVPAHAPAEGEPATEHIGGCPEFSCFSNHQDRKDERLHNQEHRLSQVFVKNSMRKFNLALSKRA